MEAKHGPAIPAIKAFLDTEILRLELKVGEKGKTQTSVAPLNDLFREMPGKVWEEKL